jgi:Lon protease-like protein
MQSRPVAYPAVPVFPLPDFYLFPGTAAPLHIFEERYRQMMADLMDRRGRLVTVPYSSSEPVGEDGPALPEIGTLAEIVHHEKLDDGRYLILLLALGRVKVEEIESDRPYRQVRAEVLAEPELASLASGAARRDLLDALAEWTTGSQDVPADAPVGRLADVLLQALPLGEDQLRRAYLERDPLVRASLALAWHHLLHRPEDGQEEE